MAMEIARKKGFEKVVMDIALEEKALGNF